MTDFNHDPVVPRVGVQADLAGATAYPNELLWTSDTFRLYIEQGGAKKLVGEADFLKLAGGVLSGAVTFTNTGLKIKDTNDSHTLSITPGSDLTGDKILTITTGDSDRTITLSGNPTLNDWFDQAVKQASGPAFASVKTGGAENLKTWTYSHTLDATDIANGYTDITITAVTLAKVRSISVTYYDAGTTSIATEATAIGGTWLASFAVQMTGTTAVTIYLGAAAAATDIVSLTIIEAT